MRPQPHSYRSTRERSLDAMLALLELRGIHDRCVLAAMTVVSREPFVETSDILDAYADHALSIGHGQTISQPYVVALMLQALELQGNEHVLEIGTGSGYSAAVLSQLAAHVYTVERDPMLSTTARARLAALGYDGIDLMCGDGSLGWPEHAPYDAIVVTAGGPTIPQALVDQLAIGGRLVMPVGSRESQYLSLLVKTSAHDYTITDLGAVAFVPLVGVQGWSEPA
ncbi:MAG: protein-L-isoaspartate(D-aspartate) O-methyltransferase [Myxococcales bacterium]|nr:protein-L-isoaspartate(D-aspartate) O-methyltransferase [Myxococcales bacterium]